MGCLGKGVLEGFVIGFVLSSFEEVLTCVAQWVVPHPANERSLIWFPLRTSLVCRPGPGMGACERQVIKVSLAHRPLPSL